MTAAPVRSDIGALTADIVVIGAGPAGIAAATCAAERGLHVVIMDRGLEPGGQIWRHQKGARVPRDAQQWLGRLARSSARVLTSASVVDAHATDHGVAILASVDGRAVHVHAATVVLATGARELFIPFQGWTLPGVLGIGGAQAMLKSGASFRGKSVAIAGSGPLMLPVAAALARAGARIVLVAEQASSRTVARFAAGLARTPRMLLQAARYRARFASTRYRTGSWITAAHGADRVQSITVCDGHRAWHETVDVLCTGYGLIPNVELAQLLGCNVDGGVVTVDREQRTTVPNVLAIGETTGIGGVELSLVEGEIAAATVLSQRPRPALLQRRTELCAVAERMARTFALRNELRALVTPDTIMCRCEDVRYADMQRATCARQARLYTRLGMGSCQGRTCLPAIEFLLGWAADTVRPPVEPTPVAVLSSDFAVTATSCLSSPSSVGAAIR